MFSSDYLGIVFVLDYTSYVVQILSKIINAIFFVAGYIKSHIKFYLNILIVTFNLKIR